MASKLKTYCWHCLAGRQCPEGDSCSFSNGIMPKFTEMVKQRDMRDIYEGMIRLCTETGKNIHDYIDMSIAPAGFAFDYKALGLDGKQIYPDEQSKNSGRSYRSSGRNGGRPDGRTDGKTEGKFDNRSGSRPGSRPDSSESSRPSSGGSSRSSSGGMQLLNPRVLALRDSPPPYRQTRGPNQRVEGETDFTLLRQHADQRARSDSQSTEGSPCASPLPDMKDGSRNAGLVAKMSDTPGSSEGQQVKKPGGDYIPPERMAMLETGGSTADTSKNWRTKCKFIANGGSCWRGDQCYFAH
jgi:hypothetical protein